MRFTSLIALVGVATALRIEEGPTATSACAEGPAGDSCRADKAAARK